MKASIIQARNSLKIAILIAVCASVRISVVAQLADPVTGLPVVPAEDVPAEDSASASSTPLPSIRLAPDPFEVPNPDPAEQQAALDQALIEAVVAENARDVQQALRDGANPDTPLPSPAPDEMAEPHRQTPLFYYLKRERNFTVLMMASGLGNREIVDLLLKAGANPTAKTKRNKTLAIQLAAKAEDPWIQQRLLGVDENSPANEVSVEIDLTSQTVHVFQNGVMSITAPISSGRASHPTPTGTFVVTDRWRSWTSTIYKVKMPYFLRLSCSEVGLHAGRLPGYPASHGCIRLARQDAKEIFEMVPLGTLVTVR